VSIAIIFPAIGAAITGIRINHEYHRNAERYSNMAYHLSIISERITEEANDMKTMTALLEEANELMLREHQDWRIVFMFQKLEAP
jgi:urease gamma subunit